MRDSADQQITFTDDGVELVATRPMAATAYWEIRLAEPAIQFPLTISPVAGAPDDTRREPAPSHSV